MATRGMQTDPTLYLSFLVAQSQYEWSQGNAISSWEQLDRAFISILVKPEHRQKLEKLKDAAMEMQLTCQTRAEELKRKADDPKAWQVALKFFELVRG